MTVSTVEFNGAQVPRTSDVNVDYAIDDSGVLTFAVTGPGQMSAGNGAVFNATAGAYHFTATTSGPNKTGGVIINGNASSAAPLYSYTNGQGGAFNLATTAGSYVTIVGGTNALGVTGTITNVWATSHGGVAALTAANSNLTWKNLDVVDNGFESTTTGYGGVVYSIASGNKLEFENVTFKNNTAKSSATANGGVIYLTTSGTLIGRDVAFVGNSVVSNRTNSGYGGAIYAHTASTVYLTNANFDGNSASGIGGGAIYVQASSLVINGGTFANNIVTGAGNGTSNSSNGGAIYVNACVAEFTDVVFTSNTTNTTGKGTQGRGGAIYVGGGTITYTVTSDITNIGNAAVASGGSAPTPDNGGFLMYGGNNCLANFNVADTKTLTIGSAATPELDTFSSGGQNAFHVISINPDGGYSGTVVLNADNSAYTSDINVMSGALLMGHDQAKLSFNRIAVASGGIFGGAGSVVVTGSYVPGVTVNLGGALQMGRSRLAAETLTISGTVTLAAGAILDYGIYAGNSSDQLVLADGVVPLVTADAAGPFTSTLNVAGPVTINLSAATKGTYDLISMPAGIAAGSNLTAANLDTLFNVTVDGVALDPASYALDIAADNTLFIVVDTGVSDIAPPDTSASTGTDITATSFTANWPSVVGATGYVIDVATDPSFATVTMVAGYNKLSVPGTSVSVTGLTPGATYYYRVRSVDADGAGANSDIVTVVVSSQAPGPATALFTDTFGAGSTLNAAAPLAAPTATSASYIVISEKGKQSADVMSAGSLGMGQPSTTSAASMIEALFTTTPVTLATNGEYIEIALTFTNVSGPTMSANNGSMMAVGLYNAAQVAPYPEGQYSHAAGNAPTGYAEDWKGNYYNFSWIGSNTPSGVYQRLGATVAQNQEVIYKNVSAISVGATGDYGIGAADATGNLLTNGQTYTLFMRIMRESATSIQVDGAMYQGATTAGTLMYSRTHTGVPAAALTFDALAFGWAVKSNSAASVATVNSITIGTGTGYPVPQPPAAPLATDATDIDNTTFTANWDASAGATAYLLEVATDAAFTSPVTGYVSRDVGATTSASVTGLTIGNTYYYRVRALNANGGSGYSNTITATTAPPITVVPVITSATAISAEVGQFFTYNIIANNATTSYAATNLPATLTLDPATGEITGTPIDTDIGIHSITLTATNHIGTSLPVTLTLTVAAAMTEPPVISSDPMATGQQDTAFSYQINASNLPISYALDSGALPAGVTLDTTTGLISGTPTANGVFNISVTATNTFAACAPFAITITINPPLPAITSALTASATTGEAFNYQIGASNSPTSYAAPDLPAGLTLNAATGLITGTPATEAEGVYNINLTATNATGASPAATLVLTIIPPPAAITSSLAATGMVDVAFAYQITASNAPSSFAAAGLPAGLALNAATGAIAGTPAAEGAFNVNLTATNGAGAGPSSVLVITIAPLAVPLFASAPNASGMVDETFTFQVDATHGPGFTATGLPPGLSIDSAGAITGTPTTSGSYDVVILAANHVASNTQQLTITIDGKTALVTYAGAAGTAGKTDGAIATASFNAPAGAVADAGGNLFIADTENHAIRRIAPDGQVSTLALAGLVAPAATAISPDGAILYIADPGSDQIHAVTLASGQVAPVAAPAAITGNNQIRAAALASGQVATIAITGLNAPSGVAVDPDGNLYIANTGANTIIKIAAGSGAQTTLAGSAGSAGTIDGTGASARFNLPTGLAVSPDGATLYVADTCNNTIRAIDLFSRQVTTLAGAAQQPGFADGAPAAARFNTPQSLAVDAAGNVYVADTGNNTIRKIAALTNGVTTTLAGTAGADGSADGSGLQAQLAAPAGIAIDADGDVYIADTGNNTIRVLQTGPTILVQPGSRTVTAGAPASLTVVAGGAPNPTYQWTRNSVALSGGTAATYDIPAASASDSGAYAVTVTNLLGAVTSVPATLTVSEAPTPPVEQPSTGGGGGGGGGGGAPTWLFLCALTALAAARGHSSRRNR
jgi:predicted outer membrane repeat protein